MNTRLIITTTLVLLTCLGIAILLVLEKPSHKNHPQQTENFVKAPSEAEITDSVRILDLKLKTPTSKYTLSQNDYFLYLVVVNSNDVNVKDLTMGLSDFNRNYHREKELMVQSYEWKLQDKVVVSTLGLRNLTTARAYHKSLLSNQKFLDTHHLTNAPKAFINHNNFKVLIKAQNEEEYMQFFESNY